ncbi:hypothetical protein ACFXNW_28445 [Nocardia sp. NPDC059180]|uniref:hypothetical protein n=1 Tax=Nocardia sp. NPDC059180 TaxID=3346761 RepID=UPI0036CBD280
MVSATLLLLAGIQLTCVYLLWTRTARIARLWVLGVIGLGLAYDAAIFGLGAVLGEGQPLHALSVGRFLGHALLTPLLVLWAVDRIDAGRRWRWAALVLTGVLLGWGIVEDVVHLRLVPRHFADTFRYASQTPAVPVPALAATAVLIVAGVVLWRREGLRFPLLGTLILVAASGAAVAVPLLGNAGEAVMLCALTGAELARSHRKSRKNSRTSPTRISGNPIRP